MESAEPTEFAEFEQLVVEAIENLPAAFQRYFENVDVIVLPRPDRELRRAHGIKPWQSLYGLYVGIPLTERGGDLPSVPDTIYIFQQALERDFRNPHQLREEIRRTVLHEIAHHFGISDERLHELGAY